MATALCMECPHQTYGFESAKGEAENLVSLAKSCLLLSTLVTILVLLRSPLIIRMEMALSFPPGPGILWSFEHFLLENFLAEDEG